MLLIILCCISGLWFYFKTAGIKRAFHERCLWSAYGFVLFLIVYVSLSFMIAEIFDASSSTILAVVIVALILSSGVVYISGKILPETLPRPKALAGILRSPHKKLIMIAVMRIVIAVLAVGVFCLAGAFLADEYNIKFQGSDDFNTGLTFSISLASMFFYYVVCDYLIALVQSRKIPETAMLLLISAGGIYLYMLCAFWLRLLSDIRLPLLDLR